MELIKNLLFHCFILLAVLSIHAGGADSNHELNSTDPSDAASQEPSSEELNNPNSLPNIAELILPPPGEEALLSQFDLRPGTVFLPIESTFYSESPLFGSGAEELKVNIFLSILDSSIGTGLFFGYAPGHQNDESFWSLVNLPPWATRERLLMNNDPRANFIRCTITQYDMYYRNLNEIEGVPYELISYCTIAKMSNGMTYSHYDLCGRVGSNDRLRSLLNFQLPEEEGEEEEEEAPESSYMIERDEIIDRSIPLYPSPNALIVGQGTAGSIPTMRPSSQNNNNRQEFSQLPSYHQNQLPNPIFTPSHISHLFTPNGLGNFGEGPTGHHEALPHANANNTQPPYEYTPSPLGPTLPVPSRNQRQNVQKEQPIKVENTYIWHVVEQEQLCEHNNNNNANLEETPAMDTTGPHLNRLSIAFLLNPIDEENSDNEESLSDEESSDENIFSDLELEEESRSSNQTNPFILPDVDGLLEQLTASESMNAGQQVDRPRRTLRHYRFSPYRAFNGPDMRKE